MEIKDVAPFISICISSYNYGFYLEKLLESIDGQSFRDFEIVCVDDASEDDSVPVIDRYIEKHPEQKVRLVVHEENRGILVTKTELLEMAQGEYVMLCDSDDWMGDGCLEKLAEAARGSGADRVVSQVYDVDSHGKVIQIQDFARKPSKWLWNLHHGCLYRRDVISEHGIRIRLMPDDVYLSTLYNLYGKNGVCWVREPRYYWLVHRDSFGRRGSGDRKKLVLEFSKIIHFLYGARMRAGEEAGHDIELLATKLYFLYLFHEGRTFPMRAYPEIHDRLKAVMGRYFPDHLKNPLLFRTLDAPARAYAMKIMRLGCLMEKINVIKPALLCYHVVSRGIFFDQ